jgi:SAM-dependent methyltransferase
MHVYDDMAEQYDNIYSDTYDAEFYLREAREADGPVLEIACGTGRILLRLLSSGVDIVGLDSSPSMLEVLKIKAKERGLNPKIFLADMRDFQLKKRFKLIIIPYRSILHLTNDDKRKALQTIVSHLAEGGRLILHTYNPSEEHLGMVNRFHMVDQEECSAADGRKYHIGWYMEFFPETDSGRYKIVLDFHDEHDRSHVYLMDLFFIRIEDMEKMLAGCGLKSMKKYCGFDYSGFNEDCREVLWIAER